MIRRPPRSTLFPSRRSSDLSFSGDCIVRTLSVLAGFLLLASAAADASSRNRSEEHTSELQSRLHLVCRLLLEKKKIQNHHELQNQPYGRQHTYHHYLPHRPE